MYYLWCAKEQVWIDSSLASVYFMEDTEDGNTVYSFDCANCGGCHKSVVEYAIQRCL